MTFEAATLTHLENILSDAFEYHNGLDSFLMRAGISSQLIAEVRSKAEERCRALGRYSKAPKRYVVQELIDTLQHDTENGTPLLSGLLTQVIHPNFLSLTQSQSALDSVKCVIDQIERNKEQKKKEDEEKIQFVKQREDQENQSKEASYVKLQKAKEEFRNRFLALQAIPNPQERGYVFERFLEEYFDYAGMEPRGSFKIVGEQIDGSFIFQHNTHLLEAKWTKDPCAGAEFGAFMFKLSGKSADTRGLFVSINGYTPTALEALTQKGALSLICIDGSHIMRSFEPSQSFKRILETLWRHTSETGQAYLPVSKMNL